ncbi:Wall-associated receptor kinase-like 14 [Hibiscus syriacus]|uniref:Wall-associated receptor kinase-like 14 n=1 Tax=Hibiscus syriacus TaxID=106335 RepID=A0A6A3BR21_HIBSY|nr:Wall-associated receptor kinase-like 14 [Hibiscus syriacus]
MIMFQAKLPFSIAITLLFLVSQTKSVHSENNTCHDSCETSDFTRTLPFPFGFSSGCPIRLNCNRTGVTIGNFDVHNVTSRDIVVHLPSKCDRRLTSISALFTENYAVSTTSSLLLQNCSKPISAPCEIRPRFLDPLLNLDPCLANSDNITCFAGNQSERLLSFEEVNQTECRFFLSSTSFVVDSARNSSFSLEFGRVNLGWWIKGPCDCDGNASCKLVKRGNSTLGFNCLCNEGFEGDGFRAGAGCRRVSKCNASECSNSPVSKCNVSKYVSGKCGGTTRVFVLIGGLAGGALLMGAVSLLCCYVRRRTISMNKLMNAKRLVSEAANNSSVPFYDYREIEKATNGFSDEHRLGTGAYGAVYSGKLQNVDWVAIKRFRFRDPASIDQVMNEIKLLSSVSHPNLVRLLGCCIEEGEPILVYEFMPNGTLFQHLQRERGQGLPWTVRLTIAAETAKAIAYLHSVADFGLSRLGMTESSHISTAPQGTPGYLDPEYHQYFHLSDKSDVYSFGVVLVEIITALKVVDFSRSHCEVNLAALANDRIKRGCIDEIIDPYLDPHRDAWTLSSIHNVAELAFRCLAFHGDMRPAMSEVAEELEHIRLTAWVPGLCIESPSGSSSPSSDDESAKSLSTKTVKSSSSVIGSWKLIMKQRRGDYSSPVSVQDDRLSGRSSPSTNSLLANASLRE